MQEKKTPMMSKLSYCSRLDKLLDRGTFEDLKLGLPRVLPAPMQSAARLGALVEYEVLRDVDTRRTNVLVVRIEDAVYRATFYPLRDHVLSIHKIHQAARHNRWVAGKRLWQNYASVASPDDQR
jgi:hypothetical protein